jgi:hypothetical protein
MNPLMSDRIIAFIAVIEEAGIPALRCAFTLAVIVFLLVSIFIFRRRHQFFERDPDVDNDVPVVRHNREEAILFVWGGLTLVLVSLLYQALEKEAGVEVKANGGV